MLGFITDLPAELRLDIYERALQFEYPLRRIKPIDELDGTIDDEMRQYVRGGPANVAIMLACKKTYQEALPVFYKLNTMSLCHGDVCLLTREQGFTRCAKDLVQRILVVDWLESGPWTRCPACAKNVLEFLNTFCSAYFPRLQALTLDLECFAGGYAALGEQLLKYSADVTFDFTAVGCFTIKEPATQPQINFRFTTVATTWAYYSYLPPQHYNTVFSQLRRRAPITAQLHGIDPRFVRYVREILWNYHDYQEAKEAEAVVINTQPVLRGVDLRWIEPDRRGSEAFERLTDKLLQRLEVLSRSRR